jgi:Flp pilus assembly protein TadG
MTMPHPVACPILARVVAFCRDRRAAAALEFAIVSTPFFLVLLCTMQIGVYYFVQSALDTGVLQTAQTLYSGFRTGTTANLPGASSLKSLVASKSGGLITNDATLSVEIQPITNLSSGSVAITDGVNNYGTTTSTLMLRAQAKVPAFAPGFSSLTVATSSAIVRRQGT